MSTAPNAAPPARHLAATPAPDADTYPIVRVGTGTATHALETFGWDSSLCGVRAFRSKTYATEPGTPVTCKRCRRALATRPATNLRASATLAIGQEQPQ